MEHDDEGEGQRVRVCPYCFSHDIEERTLIGGPMAQLDNDDGTFKCHKCGRVAVPLDFASWEEYMAFTWEKEALPAKKFKAIPMMPLIWDDLTRESFVTEIAWKGRLVAGPRKVLFKDYWYAASKEAYDGNESFIIDVAGTLTGNARVNELQRIMRRKVEISLDVGIRNEHDVYDCFTMGAWEVIACSWAIPSIDIFEDIMEMTDRCIPCLCHDRNVVWGKEKGNPVRLEDAVVKLKDFGYDKIAYIDLWGLGKQRFRGEDILIRILEKDVDVIAGGGISKDMVPRLQELGAKGAIFDPFAPELEPFIGQKII